MVAGGLEMSDETLKFLKDIAESIMFTLENKHFLASLILTYSAIDCMASLIMPEDQKDVKGADFQEWVDTYMKADQDQPYKYRGIDLWGARCGLVHRYSPYSSVSERGECKVFQYHNGNGHRYDPKINEDVVLVSALDLVRDFHGAIAEFIRFLIKNKELYRRASSRMKTLFQIAPITG
jgi:hypothetical protein